MAKIVVTGGSGFIGTNLVESLVNQNNEVLNIDTAQPKLKGGKSSYLSIDILDQEKLKKAIVDFDPEIIVHLAARTDLDGKHLEDYAANTQGTQNIIDIAAELKNLKKVIFTSSMYVCQPGFIPKDYDTYKAHTVYGESKVQGELMVKALNNVNYDWVIVRPTSIWGPWFNIPYIDFFKIVYEKKYFDFGKSCTKTYGFVDNIVFQIEKIIAAENISGSTFYLGDFPAININEWAEEISLVMGKGKIRKIPFGIIKTAAFVGDILKRLNINFPITSFRLSNMLTDNILPLQNMYDLAGTPPCSRHEGIQKTVKWLKEHKGYQIDSP